MTGRITLTGLAGKGFHGVLPAERRDGQEFVVDVVLHLDTSRAAAGDDLSATVNYADLATDVLAVVTGEPVDLIETLAHRIAEVALDAGHDVNAFVTAAEVTVHKPQAPIPARFADVSVGVTLRRRTPAVIALGSNLGDRAATLRAAVAGLGGVPGLEIDVVSPFFETEPVGGPEQGAYLNAVVLVTAELAPRELLARLQGLEAAHGRTRDVRWGPRTLDLDLIVFGELASSEPDLTLPHPRAHERAFVLVPWSRVDPGATLAGRGRVADLAQRAADRDGLRLFEEES